MDMPFWEVINQTGTDIQIITEDPRDPGVTIPAGQTYGTEVWHSNSFNFRVITRDGRSKVFYDKENDLQDHFIKIYSDPDGTLQVETSNLHQE